MIGQTSDTEFGGVTPVTPVSPDRAAAPIPLQESSTSLPMSGITPQLQAAARSAYRSLYRASASTFAGEWLRNGPRTPPLNLNAGEQVTMRSSRVGSRFATRWLLS